MRKELFLGQRHIESLTPFPETPNPRGADRASPEVHIFALVS